MYLTDTPERDFIDKFFEIEGIDSLGEYCLIIRSNHTVIR